MLKLRQVAPSLARNSAFLKELSTSQIFSKSKDKTHDDEDDKQEEGFELLPPGCSMVDPTYGLSVGDPVYFADHKPSPQAPAGKGGKRVPQTPANLEAAQQQLKDKKRDSKPEEEEPYVYLPPGSSLREPGYNSMSDPVGGRVYYRDPQPVVRKK